MKRKVSFEWLWSVRPKVWTLSDDYSWTISLADNNESLHLEECTFSQRPAPCSNTVFTNSYSSLSAALQLFNPTPMILGTELQLTAEFLDVWSAVSSSPGHFERKLARERSLQDQLYFESHAFRSDLVTSGVKNTTRPYKIFKEHGLCFIPRSYSYW